MYVQPNLNEIVYFKIQPNDLPLELCLFTDALKMLALFRNNCSVDAVLFVIRLIYYNDVFSKCNFPQFK